MSVSESVKISHHLREHVKSHHIVISLFRYSKLAINSDSVLDETKLTLDHTAQSRLIVHVLNTQFFQITFNKRIISLYIHVSDL